MDVSEPRRLKSLEEENARLKRLPADAMLDRGVKDILGNKDLTPAAERQTVARLVADHGMSERRACRVLKRGNEGGEARRAR